MTIPQTQNTDWGFYGTINTAIGFKEKTTDKIWNAMAGKIKALYPQCTDEQAVDFLDSRIGRHLADDIGVNIGNRKSTKILLAIKNMPTEYMGKWWQYYNSIG
jgi:hypothetical protein